jgi:hypothetical protein
MRAMVRSRSRTDASAAPDAPAGALMLPSPPGGSRPARTPAWGGAVLLVLVVVALLVPFAAADPPAGLTGSNAPWTDEGFNLANARNRVLFGTFHTDDVDRSLTNGPYSGVAALVFAATDPSVPAGRAVSVAATAAAVLLFAAGLARPLGRRAALLAAVALGGCQLLLAYGRLGFTEPLVIALLAAALVLMARAAERPSLVAGAGGGVLLVAAVLTKAIAAVPAAAILGVAMVAAALRRDARALGMSLVAVASALGAAGAWAALVALPNLDRLLTGLRIWPEVSYPLTPVAVVRRLGEYLGASDGALPRAVPLLAAAAVGLAFLVWRWGSLRRAQRDLLLTGALWGAATWGAIALGDYAPNRYVLPALPGLAILAGFGLDALVRAARLPTPRFLRGRQAGGVRTAAAQAAVGVALTVAVAAPGMSAAFRTADAAGEQLQRAQRMLSVAVGDGAVVFGSYGPTMLLSTDARLVTPWAPAGANVDEVAERFGVTHVLSDGRDEGVEDVVAALLRDATPLVQVPWGPHTLTLYELQ